MYERNADVSRHSKKISVSLALCPEQGHLGLRLLLDRGQAPVR
jgi:hypothetical protein